MEPPAAYRPVPPIAVRAVCAKPVTAGAVRTPPRKHYSFNADVIDPVPFGPRIRDMPRVGIARSLGPLVREVAFHARELRACYRWARHAGLDVDATLVAQLEIDELRTVAVTVSGDPHTRELAACVEDVLADFWVQPFVPRRASVSLPLRFHLSGLKRPARRPDRPRRQATRRPRPGCVQVPEELPHDRLAAEGPVVDIDDHDDEQAWEEKVQESVDAWKRGGKKGPRPRLRRAVVPVVRHAVGRPHDTELDRGTIREIVRHNTGAYGACLAAARLRRADVAGVANLSGVVHLDGTFHEVVVESSTTADAALDDCLRAAFAELWFPAADMETAVQFPLEMGPPVRPAPALPARATAASIEASARSALASLDGEHALRRYTALLAQAPADPRRCWWRLGVVDALAVQAPWTDQRVMAAATTFVDEAVAKPQPRACLEAARESLGWLAIATHRRGRRALEQELLELAVERYALVLRIPDLPGADALRRYQAAALISLGRTAEADHILAGLPAGSEPEVPRERVPVRPR